MISNFKKTIFCLAVLAAGAASAQTTNQGKITMHGRIIASTCEVNIIQQPGAKDATVSMGVYGAGDFKQTGDVVGGTGVNGHVDFQLSNCPEGKTKAIFKMDADTVDGRNDTIKLDPNGNNAGNVGIYVYNRNKDDSPLQMGNTYEHDIDHDSKTASIELVGKYVSLADQVTPGEANGHFNYTISYN